MVLAVKQALLKDFEEWYGNGNEVFYEEFQFGARRQYGLHPNVVLARALDPCFNLMLPMIIPREEPNAIDLICCNVWDE